MLNLPRETLSNQTFSLYALPLIGALAVFLLSFLMLIPSLQDTFRHWHYFGVDLSALWQLFIPLFIKVGGKFVLILMLAYHFRVTVYSLKNAVVIFLYMGLLEVTAGFITVGIFNLLNTTNAFFLIYLMGDLFHLLVNLLFYLGGLWLLFKFSETSLDRFTGTCQKTARYWRVANFISLFFVTAFMSEILMVFYSFFGFGSLLIEASNLILIMNGATAIALFFLVFSKKIALQRLEIPTIIHTGFFLGFWIIAILAIFEWFINQADHDASMEDYITVMMGGLVLYAISIMVLVYRSVQKRFGRS